MWKKFESRFDAASGLATGKRENQEDAITTEFHAGADQGFAILSDGMGGHKSGEIASRVILSSLMYSLNGATERLLDTDSDIPESLRVAAQRANDDLGQRKRAIEADEKMGATLLAFVASGDRLHWVSVGDSLLYLLRKGSMYRLNEIHSMAKQIDFMAENGLMEADAAKSHPDRNNLTSAVLGTNIEHVDCPSKPVRLQKGDVVLMSSDGLISLPEMRIKKILKRNRGKPSSQIVMSLLSAVEAEENPRQDNVAIAVLKVNHTRPVNLAAHQQASDPPPEAVEEVQLTAAE